MKTLLLSSLLLVGCVSNPNVTVTTPDGGSVKLSTGTNFMAEVDEQVSEVEGGGFHLRHMVKRQDATRVPIAAIQAVVSYGVAKWAAHTQDLKTTTDGAVATEGIKADVAKKQIDATAAATAGEQANEALKITTKP